jgi:hypothetical protein
MDRGCGSLIRKDCRSIWEKPILGFAQPSFFLFWA